MHFSVEQSPRPHSQKASNDFNTLEVAFDRVNDTKIRYEGTESAAVSADVPDVWLGDDHPTLERQSSDAVGRKLKTELDMSYASALHSAEWMDRLEREGDTPLKRLGRKGLNLIGMTSPRQKDIKGHRTNIDAYKDQIGLEDLSDDRHIEKRDELVREEFSLKFKDYLRASVAENQIGEDSGVDVRKFLIEFCGYDQSVPVTDFIDSLESDALASAYKRYEDTAEHVLNKRTERKLAELKAMYAAQRSEEQLAIDNRRRAEVGLRPVGETEALLAETQEAIDLLTKPPQ